MIVDDSIIIRKVLQRYASEYNIEIVASASNGKMALELFREHSPEYVTMDITMPEMDGLSALEEILKLAPETKVLIITALSDPGVAICALKMGAKAVLNKPFTADEFRLEFSALLENS